MCSIFVFQDCRDRLYMQRRDSVALKTWPRLSSKCCGDNNCHGHGASVRGASVRGAGSPNSSILSYLETLKARWHKENRSSI